MKTTISTNFLAEKLIVFTRFPEAGTTKTRLIPALGAVGAAGLQRELTERTVRTARQLAAKRGTALELCCAGGDAGQVRAWLGGDLSAISQGDGDLGARMARAFARSWRESYRRVVLVGADCPALSAPLLQEALVALAGHDLVLGPAADGGYYLVGLSRPAPELFTEQPWGEATLLASTLDRARLAGLSVQLLEELADVDRPEDLRHLGDYSNPG